MLSMGSFRTFNNEESSAGKIQKFEITFSNTLRHSRTTRAPKSQPFVSSSCRVPSYPLLASDLTVTVPTRVHFHIFVANAIARLTGLVFSRSRSRRGRGNASVPPSGSISQSRFFFFSCTARGYIRKKKERKRERAVLYARVHLTG